MEYRAPKAGYYEVVSQMTKAIPTGQFETVPNPTRYWFEFWKPKTVTREIYRFENLPTAREVKYLEAGQIVEFPIIQRLSN